MAEQKRQGFEEWFLGRHIGTAMGRDDNGDYIGVVVRECWLSWQAALSHAEGEAVAQVIPDVIGVSIAWIEPPASGRPAPGTKLYTRPAPQVAGWQSGYPEYDGEGGVCHIPLNGHPDFMVVAFNRDGNLVDSCGDDVGYELEDVERWQPIGSHPAPQVAVPEGYAVVPVEPTNEMQEAGGRAIRFDTTTMNKLWTGNKVYAAMLAAAPTAPAGESDDSDICERVELPHVLAWADGVRGDMRTEYADRITDEEARVAQAVWAAHTGEQPVSDPDGPGRVLMPRALTAENGAKAALSGEFSVSMTVTCSACHYDEPDDECEFCGGEREYQQSEAVPWTTIKRIYSAAVDLLSAPAPDEREIAARALEEMSERLREEAKKTMEEDDLGLFAAVALCRQEAIRLRAGKEGEDHA